MPESTSILPDTIECPLCLGKGELGRTEVMERLGMRDYARVAQLSAEEAIRLIMKKEKDAEQARWLKFDSELSRRLAAAADKHNAELQRLQAEKSELAVRLEEFQKSATTTLANARQQERLTVERELQKQLTALTKQIAGLEAAQKLAHEQKAAEITTVKAELEAALSAEKARADDLDRRVSDHFREIGELLRRNEKLEPEMAKVARVGRKEELDFAEEVRSWPGVWVGEKLPRNGDYLMAFSDAAGNAVEPTMVVDNKDKAAVAESDVRKLVRDAKERKLAVAVLVARDESQLRNVDRQCRWGQEDGVWLLRSTRAWLPRDLEVLRPLFERMRAQGPDFLQANGSLADEVRRTLADLDEIEGQLKKAGAAVAKAQAMATKYRSRLIGLCENVSAGHNAHGGHEERPAQAGL
jgi:hypothetical protein